MAVILADYAIVGFDYADGDLIWMVGAMAGKWWLVLCPSNEFRWTEGRSVWKSGLFSKVALSANGYNIYAPSLYKRLLIMTGYEDLGDSI